ncbi:MAG: sigma-54 dependent transcriptional regulator [Pirellulales bacterium]
MSHILVVDDEPAIGWSLREMLSDDGHDVVLAASVAEAFLACGRVIPDVVLLDVRLPGRDGISAIPELKSATADAPVIVMTAFGDLDTAVRAVRAGAFDYLVKPFNLDHVATVVARALAERSLRDERPATADANLGTLVGSSTAMQEVYQRIALVADNDLPVLITGPSGSGKELAARAIHAHGRRPDSLFVATNLTALSPGAVAAELFGHADGRLGLVAAAAGGTLFLAGIEALPPDVQSSLLRLLESKEVDVRVIAATKRNLSSLPAPAFRRDLLDRLRVVEIAMPALEERRDDIEPLARCLLARFLATNPQGTAAVMSREFLDALASRDWPGNVRELRHAVEHAAVVARGGVLRPEHLPPATAGPIASAASGSLDAAAGGVGAAVKEWAATARASFAPLPEPDLHHRTMQLVEATLLREALAHTGGNRTAAAKLLGLDRATLRTKLRLLGIDD